MRGFGIDPKVNMKIKIVGKKGEVIKTARLGWREDAL